MMPENFDDGKYNEDNQKKVGLSWARKHLYITTSSVVRLPEGNGRPNLKGFRIMPCVLYSKPTEKPVLRHCAMSLIY